mmetsp:Transcript_4594/g.9225  ORF Transcript_4594/g.9225 Transcript_4594/m.9225 type:complete len:83 (-) Transcript_4594:1303-1551(-)
MGVFFLSVEGGEGKEAMGSAAEMLNFFLSYAELPERGGRHMVKRENGKSRREEKGKAKEGQAGQEGSHLQGGVDSYLRDETR